MQISIDLETSYIKGIIIDYIKNKHNIEVDERSIRFIDADYEELKYVRVRVEN